MLITSLTGFNIAFTNVENTLKQRQDKVVSTLFQRCFNVGHRRCINVIQRWKSYVGFSFIFYVGSTLFKRWSITLKQRWSDVEMLAEAAVLVWTTLYLINHTKEQQNTIHRLITKFCVDTIYIFPNKAKFIQVAFTLVQLFISCTNLVLPHSKCFRYSNKKIF